MIEFPELGLTAPDGSIIGVIEEGTRADWPTGDYLLDHAFAQLDAVAKSRAVSRLVQERRAGATYLLISHDETLLENCADEIWWLRDGKLVARGDPLEVLTEYRRYV